MDAVASPPDLETNRPSAVTMPDQIQVEMAPSNPEINTENVPQQNQSQHQAEQPIHQISLSLPVDQRASQMDVDQEPPSLSTADIHSNAAPPVSEDHSGDIDSSSQDVVSTSSETTIQQDLNPAAGQMAGLPENLVIPNATPSETAMDAVIYDVTDSTTVTMPNDLNDEQTSPLHRMAEIALATSPIMSNGTINRGNDYRPDGTMVLPSQQYYQSGTSLFVPPSLSARERYEIDASRTLGKTESITVYPSSYPPSSSNSDPHPFGYRHPSPSHPGMNGRRRSSADDSAGHRYTHSRLQPKNKSPPSFRVVQLRGGVADGAGEGVPQQQMSTVASESGVNGTSPSNTTTHLEQQPGAAHDAWQGNDHASYSDRPYYPHPSYTDPIPHAQIHRYQAPEPYSSATSPVMNDQSMLPPVQPQNRLSLFDLVLAAEASAAREDAEQKANGSRMDASLDGQMSPVTENQPYAGASGSAEKKSKQRKNSKKKAASDHKLPHDPTTAAGHMDPTSVPSKSHKRKEKDAASSDVKVEAGIVGHIPLRENSRSISKLLWAEPGQGKASRRVDLPVDHVELDEEEDIMPEEAEPVSVTYIDADEQEDPQPKGKKRQSNGAVKTSTGTGNGKSGSASKGKGKKKAEEQLPMDDVEEEIDSQPKKKGKKNESTSKSKSKTSVGQAKGRAGSLDSSVAAEKKSGRGGKQKSVQIDEQPEFFEPVSSRKGRGKNQAASPEPIEEEEEEDNTLYCVCKKPFSEDSSTMVECDVCQNWYHIKCVGVAEEDIGLLDQYVCPVCDQDPTVTLKTCYKDKCQREGCRRPGRGALSKFCSDTCGIHYALERMKTNKVEPKQIVKSLSTVIQPEGIVQRVSSGKSIDRQHMETSDDAVGQDVTPTVEGDAPTSTLPFQDRTVRAREANALQNAETRKLFEQRQQKIQLALGELSRQDAMLQRAIETAESLPDLHADDAEEQVDEDAVVAAEAKKSKKKKSSKRSKGSAAEKAAEERPCGFDMRFVNEDGSEHLVPDNAAGQQDVIMGNGDEQDQTSLCLLPKKKCERHAGWQKLRTADLDLMRSNLTLQLEQVNKLLETCDTQALAEPILVNGHA